ncbi:MAG TPA: TetR/AcrR family transcriptional regulator [Terriglobia bacterium]|nr:TetR/AcrR family transcriptional regulator [Terriglobia bacterium]
MPQRLKVQDQSASTRDRILQAAILRFAHHSYEDAKLRDIAADVGVDVAYVHRSFGSKEQLFSEVVSAAFEPRHLITVEDGDIATKLTKRLFEPSLDQRLRLIDPLDILIRSLLSPEAIPLIRSSLMNDVIEPLENQGDVAGQVQAVAMTACLVGASIFRNVLRVEAMLEEPGGELEALLKDIIDVAMGRAKVVRTPAKMAKARKSPAKKVRKPVKGKR